MRCGVCVCMHYMYLCAVAHTQVQVLCEVLEREWAVVYYWSETLGSHMTLVHRDRDYFALLWRVSHSTYQHQCCHSHNMHRVCAHLAPARPSAAAARLIFRWCTVLLMLPLLELPGNDLSIV